MGIKILHLVFECNGHNCLAVCNSVDKTIQFHQIINGIIGESITKDSQVYTEYFNTFLINVAILSPIHEEILTYFKP